VTVPDLFRTLALVLFRLGQQRHQMRPRLPNQLTTPVFHELAHRIRDIDQRMMPRIEHDSLVQLPAIHVAGERVVESQRVVDLIPTVLAERREVLGVGRLEQPTTTSCRFGVDQELMDTLVGGVPSQLTCIIRRLLGNGPGGLEVLPARDD
jgi:hypothetical protein